eukprot:TRINITY_DN11826_c3_g2_i2.p1 TRINITY_DN11826_c3_g2~~TRINITY_DN11826_c3_g2_i2.p1  ORF type:complete len:116 (+),score=12.13 TRINITY_DN11826_c3_g2_i2:115-462(+)
MTLSLMTGMAPFDVYATVCFLCGICTVWYHDNSTLLCHRDLGLKAKLKTSRLLGIPFTVVVGQQYTARKLEVYDLHSDESNGITAKALAKLATPELDGKQTENDDGKDVVPLMSS